MYTIRHFPDTPPPDHPPVRRIRGKVIKEKNQVWAIGNDRELWVIVFMPESDVLHLRPYGNLDGRPRIWSERKLEQRGKVWEDAAEIHRAAKALNEKNPPDPDAEVNELLRKSGLALSKPVSKRVLH